MPHKNTSPVHALVVPEILVAVVCQTACGPGPLKRLPSRPYRRRRPHRLIRSRAQTGTGPEASA